MGDCSEETKLKSLTDEMLTKKCQAGKEKGILWGVDMQHNDFEVVYWLFKARIM